MYNVQKPPEVSNIRNVFKQWKSSDSVSEGSCTAKDLITTCYYVWFSVCQYRIHPNLFVTEDQVTVLLIHARYFSRSGRFNQVTA
ncbi:unnamed protein product [Fusarium graminearum]|nr:unnamed protein product [Fusarium graminearum]CAG1984664.1 unnamed protein product [Fusarium graminearum]VTO88190.1 unnamed protein product [Fusarium graminearum]